MDVDAELMFDCLLYLNLFYFPVFGICESIMCIAKYRSIILTSRIGIDAAVVSSVLFAEMLKLVIYRKLREHRKGNTHILFVNTSIFNSLLSVLCNSLAVFLTLITTSGLLYTFFLQDPVLRLEYILCSIMFLLVSNEILFGFLQIFPCCKRREYY